MHTSRVVGTLVSLGSCMSRSSGFLAQLTAKTAPRASARPTRYASAYRALGTSQLQLRRNNEAAATTSFSRSIVYSSRASRVRTRAVLALALLSSSPGVAWGEASGSPTGWASRSRRTSSSMATSAAGAGGATAARTEGVPAATGAVQSKSKPPVIFVLGGPGSGKGTQCERLAKEFGYVHLSAGELLRQERESGSSDGKLIDEYIGEGRIVPVSISLGLLRKAMEESEPFSRFLIDGFPRNSDNVQGWDDIMGDVADVRCVLFLHCPEDVLEKRLLSRGKSSGRTDDNAKTAKRRFQTYVETTLPVVEEYERQGMVARVNGNQDIQAVFRDVLSGLRAVQEKEVLDATRAAVEAVSTGDWSAYAEVCTSDVTEVLGGALTRAPGGSTGAPAPAARAASFMSRPHVRMLNGGGAVVSCERPRGPGLAGGDSGSGWVQETRVWEVHGGRWKCVHCHTSPCADADTAPRR